MLDSIKRLGKLSTHRVVNLLQPKANPQPPAELNAQPKDPEKPVKTVSQEDGGRNYYRDMNLREWLVYHQRSVVFDQCSWMGVRTFKNPMDSWIYQELLYAIRPDVIVELGSAAGGSTLYFAHMLDLLGKGEVISIDIDRSAFNVKHQRIITLTGSTSSPEIVTRVAQICEGKTVFVIHDADHHREQVLKDLRLYAPFVSVGSYLVVEDGIVDLFQADEMTWDGTEGPLPATEQFLREHPNFVVDKGRERYILTYNPKGYLKRIS